MPHAQGTDPLPTAAAAFAGWQSPTSGDKKRGDYQYDRGDHSKPRPSLVGQAKSFMGQTGRGVRLHPEFHCWLMGWPTEWTDLMPLDRGKFRQWLELHGTH